MVELLKKIIHKSLGKSGSVQIVSAKCGITVLLGLLPAVEKTQAARTKPRKQLAWDHMPSVERP